MKTKKLTKPWLLSATAVVVLGLCMGLTGCQQGDERLKEKAALEGEESAKKQIEAEKKYLEERAEEMESDLARRQRYYTGVSGVFEGTMTGQLPEDKLKVRLTFAPSLPPYHSSRVRALEEIVQDLNNLYFNVQVIQWTENGGDPSIAFGCVFENVRPDLQTGQMHLAASDCSSIYSVSLASDETIPTPSTFRQILGDSMGLANALLEQKQEQVDMLKGLRQVTKSATMFHFAVKRIEP